MTPMKQILIIFLAVGLLTACSSASDNSGLTPMPGNKDLSDAKLKEAVADFVKKRNAPPNSEFDIARVDLDNDGSRDGIVLFKLPHTYWCGWDGCGMAVFKAGKEKFTPIATISNVRGPIYVSAESNQGWKDIIIRVSGTNMPDKNIKLQYNNGSYPQSPLLAPTLDTPLSVLTTQKFFR